MTKIIIAEKPDASEHIAKALAEKGLVKRRSRYGVDYWEFQRNDEDHIVVSAVGHLFTLKQVTKGWSYPILIKDIKWMPSYEVLKKSYFSERYYRTIESLAKDDYEYIVSCDYDTEGSLIGQHILKFICKKDDAKRMFFSTLTRSDLIKSYEDAMPHLDWQNVIAGETRHYLDWLYGVNTTRALTLAIKKYSKGFSILSAGRVQGPTLTLLADREMEIQKFIPQAYWQLQLTLLLDGSEIIALYENDKIWSKDEADRIFNECKDKPAIVEDFSRKKYKQSPPLPFNITSLQTESYRLFGYSPQQTLNIAQSLYTSAYISYPRTSSEKLPPQIGYKQILEALASIDKYKALCKSLLSSSLKPVEGKRTDPAHESIHPTVEPPRDITKLKVPEQRIYDLICRRFFSVFAESATREVVDIIFDVNGHKFLASGRRTLEKGWMRFYGPYARFEEIIFPDLKKGEEVNVKKLENLEKETSPPSRYSQASIIKEMEKRNLGTRATRANILQTLYDRDYIIDRIIKVTDLGLKVSLSLKNYVPDFVDEKLTRKFEKDLEKIMQGKSDKESVLRKAELAIVKICNEFKENEDEIGKYLGEAVMQTQNDKSIVGKCPKCAKDLKILFSPKTRKYFVGCAGYKDGCRAAYPLPGNSLIQPLNKVCDKCNTPIIRVIRKGRRPFNMCLATDCPTKADWGKPRRTKSN